MNSRFLSFLVVIFFLLLLSSSLARSAFASSSFTISNSTPFLGDQLTVTGSGLTPNHLYYIYNDEAGIVKKYTNTTYEGKSAKLFNTTNTTFGTGTRYSYDLDDFDKVLVTINYYDSTAATPLFKIGASDIYWTNGGGAESIVNINSTGSNSWQTWSNAFDTALGVPDFEWVFTKIGANNVYISEIDKFPMWEVTTDANGSFSTTVTAPRTYNRSVGIDFNYKLFDPNDESSQEIDEVTLNPNYNNFRSVKDMLTFHYIYNRPNGFDPNSGGVISNQIRKDIINYRSIDWDDAFIGGILDELGDTDLSNEQATRMKNSIDHGATDLRCYPIGAGNYTDCTTAAWTNIIPVYERTGDTALYNALVDILSYALKGYNATYNNFGQSSSSPAINEFWVDAGGGKPQFFYYMSKLLHNDTYKNYANTMINTIIDKEQTPDGWVYQKYNFVTDSIDGPVFWDGGQGWALNGLREFKDEVKDDPTEATMSAKITTSLTRLADNLTARPVSDLRSDERRSSIIAYNMLKLAQDSDYPKSKRDAWQKRGEELFILAMRTMNSEHDALNRYGLTYSQTSNYTTSFDDYYMLKLLNEIYPDDDFYPNNIGTQYAVDKTYSGNSIYQALIANTNDWSSDTSSFTNDISSSSNNEVTGTVDPNAVVKLVKRDMTVSPDSGNVEVTITDWSTDKRKWSMESSSEPHVQIFFSNMSFNKTYNILRDGSIWKTVTTDSNGNVSFTYDSGFSSHDFEISLPGSPSSISNPNCIPGFVYCTEAGQHYIGTNNIYYGRSETGAQDEAIIFSGNSTINDVYVTIDKVDPYSLSANNIPLPWQQGYNTVSDIFKFQSFYAFNGLSLFSFDNPVTILLKYDPSLVYGQSPKNLRIGYYDTIDRSWKVLSYNTVLNTQKNEIANTTKILTYFAVVYPTYKKASTNNLPSTSTTISTPVVHSSSLTPSVEKVKKTSQKIPQKSTKNNHCIFFFCF